jgi:hypothetical protein
MEQMPSGVRATVSFSAGVGRPVARAADELGTVVDQVSTSVSLPDGPGSATEFLVAVDDDSDVADGVEVDDGALDPVFAAGHPGTTRSPPVDGDGPEVSEPDLDGVARFERYERRHRPS